MVNGKPWMSMRQVAEQLLARVRELEQALLVSEKKVEV